jgi:hypothetical protein
MKLPRRQFLRIATGAAALAGTPRLAVAQTYPARPVRIIVGGPPGGTLDIFARLIGQWLSERLGQPFVAENRAGGAGNTLATDVVVRAAGDGYTLLLVAIANAINASLYEKLTYDFLRDIAPVASLARVPLVMEVNPAVPARTVPEFIAFAKANPGKINMASAGNGTSPHVAGELFKLMTGVELLHVPYRGSPPALTDMLGGQIQVMFDLMPSSLALIRAGHPDRERVPARLRGKHLAGPRRAQEHPAGGDRQAQPRDQRWSRRSQAAGADCRDRGSAVFRLTRRLRSVHGGGDREMGQGGEVCRHQAGVGRRARAIIPA